MSKFTWKTLWPDCKLSKICQLCITKAQESMLTIFKQEEILKFTQACSEAIMRNQYDVKQNPFLHPPGLRSPLSIMFIGSPLFVIPHWKALYLKKFISMIKF